MSGEHALIALENEPYPHDRRVRQEAETLRDAGYLVTVCGPTGFGFEARREVIEDVRVHRYPAPPGGGGAAGYLREYTLSLAWLAALIRRANRERRVDVIIVCCPPDLMVAPALPLRRAGAALVLDHHDLSPELYEAKFGRRGPLHALLEGVEAFALRTADVVIATNDTYAEVANRRGGVDRERIFTVRNAPDPGRIFPTPPAPELKAQREHLVCWIGVMSIQEGLEHLVRAAEELVHRRGRDVTFAIVGPGDARTAVEADVRRRGLSDHFVLPGRVGDERLRQYMATADVCVSVDEPNPYNDSSTMTKVVEYMVMGRPIVQFPLRETQRVCGETTLYARPGDPLDLARRIEELLDDPGRAAALGAAARARALDGLLWPQQAPLFLEAVTRALALRRAAPVTASGR